MNGKISCDTCLEFLVNFFIKNWNEDGSIPTEKPGDRGSQWTTSSVIFVLSKMLEEGLLIPSNILMSKIFDAIAWLHRSIDFSRIFSSEDFDQKPPQDFITILDVLCIPAIAFYGRTIIKVIKLKQNGILKLSEYQYDFIISVAKDFFKNLCILLTKEMKEEIEQEKFGVGFMVGFPNATVYTVMFAEFLLDVLKNAPILIDHGIIGHKETKFFASLLTKSLKFIFSMYVEEGGWKNRASEPPHPFVTSLVGNLLLGIVTALHDSNLNRMFKHDLNKVISKANIDFQKVILYLKHQSNDGRWDDFVDGVDLFKFGAGTSLTIYFFCQPYVIIFLSNLIKFINANANQLKLLGNIKENYDLIEEMIFMGVTTLINQLVVNVDNKCAYVPFLKGRVITWSSRDTLNALMHVKVAVLDLMYFRGLLDQFITFTTNREVYFSNLKKEVEMAKDKLKDDIIYYLLSIKNRIMVLSGFFIGIGVLAQIWILSLLNLRIEIGTSIILFITGVLIELLRELLKYVGRAIRVVKKA